MKKLILLILLCPSLALGGTTNLADCDYSTVNAAISAATAGDVITCPTSAT